MDRAVILMPWRPGKHPRRRQLWDYARFFLEDIGWPIYEGDDEGKLFSRSASMNDAAEKAGKWDVALLGDADTVQPADTAREAAEIALDTGGAVIPWNFRIKLSPQGTELLVRRGVEAVTRKNSDRRDKTSPYGGGATIVVSRKAWDTVRGMDPVFRGYGNEDLAFNAALQTLVGQVQRIPGTVYHLWHPHAANVGSLHAAVPNNRRRWTEYQQASGDPKAMLRLINQRDA